MREIIETFITQGAERLLAALHRNGRGDKAFQAFISTPGVEDRIIKSFHSFSLGATEPAPARILREVEDDDYNIIASNWRALADFSLSSSERDYLVYLSMLFNSWGDNTPAPRFSPFSDLYCEAYADLVGIGEIPNEETGSRPERRAEILERARRSRYERFLRVYWEAGASYDDLMAVEPSEYGIEDISQAVGDNGITSKREAVLLALAYGYKLLQRERTKHFHSLRDIAKEAGVEYTTILEAYILIREVSTRYKSKVKLQRG